MVIKKKFDVFLSHNSRDKPWVIDLKGALEMQRVRVWLDKDEIRPGDLFAESLEKGIEESKAVALIISPESMSSGWVKAEYYRALSLATKQNLQLIPVLYKNATIPGFLEDRSWVDFSDETKYDEKLKDLIWGITGKKPNLENQAVKKNSISPTKSNKKAKEINSSLSQIKDPFVRDVERKLRMGNSHWLQAGFSRPGDGLSFTVVYYENQIEAFEGPQLFLRKTKTGIRNQNADLIQDYFLDTLENNLIQLVTRIKQVEDVLSEQEYELSLTVDKAGKTVLRNIEKVRKLALYAPMRLLSNPKEYDRVSSSLSTEIGNLSISIEVYQKYLTLIVKQAKLEKIYSS